MYLNSLHLFAPPITNNGILCDCHQHCYRVQQLICLSQVLCLLVLFYAAKDVLYSILQFMSNSLCYKPIRYLRLSSSTVFKLLDESIGNGIDNRQLLTKNSSILNTMFFSIDDPAFTCCTLLIISAFVQFLCYYYQILVPIMIGLDKGVPCLLHC